MSYLSKAWEFLKTNAVWLLLLVVGAWTGAKLLRDKESRVIGLKSALKAEAAKKEALKLRAKREALGEIDKAKEKEAERLENFIREQDRRIAEIHTGKKWEELSNEELTAALRAAGL